MKHKKRPNKTMKPSLYLLQSELRKLMQEDREAASARLDDLARKDPGSAIIIGENIGLFEEYPEDIEIAPGVYCTANCIR